MVKFLSVILLILMTTLSGFPCEDGHNDSCKETHTHTSDNGGEDDSDMCSPFCICQCCQTLAIVANFDNQDFSIDFLDIDYNSFDQGVHKNSPMFSIWNPPKQV